MNKEEYRKHCEKQIDVCIRLHDNKHLKEHELSLALLNECEERKQDKDNLIKYLEDKIEYFKQCQSMAMESRYKSEVSDFNLIILSYQDILERLKSGKYE